jgi:hypothetical protein
MHVQAIHTSSLMPKSLENLDNMHPDLDMVVKLFVTSEGELCIFHDRPFSKDLSWLEYDARSHMVDFVMDDGDLRNFGIEVPHRLRYYFHKQHRVSVIQLNPSSKKVENAIDAALILHEEI